MVDPLIPLQKTRTILNCKLFHINKSTLLPFDSLIPKIDFTKSEKLKPFWRIHLEYLSALIDNISGEVSNTNFNGDKDTGGKSL